MADFIEFSVFDGVSGDMWQWILWLEDFFVRERFTADERMNLAQSLLEGKAESWFYQNQKMLSSWKILRDSLWLRFGDFDDLDRFLQKQSDDAKLRRKKRTSITPHESISSPATIHEPVPVDKFSNHQVDEISGEKQDESHEATLVKVSDSLAEESITQTMVHVCEKKELKKEVDLSLGKIASQLKLPNTKVHVSDSENLRNIDNRTETSVLDNLETVVKEARIQKNIRMDVVNGDVERIQRVMSITTNVSAHHVFDELLLRRHKFQQRKKPSLSPKSRMFKFKNRTMLSNWSQMDLHQVIDISNVTNSYPCFSADFGLVRKKRTFQCLRLRNLRLHKQAHLSRFLYPMRMLHDPGGMKQLLHGDMQSMFVCVREFASLLEVICVWAECRMHTTTVISAKLYSLFSCEVDTAENMFRGLSQTRQVWEPGGVVAAHVLVDWLVDFNGYDRIVDGIRCLAIDSRRASRVWERGGLDISTDRGGLLVFPWNLMLLEFVLFIHLEDKVCLSGASNSWCGWLVFDRGKNNKWDAHVNSLISSMLPLNVYQMGVSDIQDNDKEMVADPVTQAVLNLVANAARFGFVSVLSQTHAVHLDVKQDSMRNQELTQSHKFKVDKFGRLNNTRLTVCVCYACWVHYFGVHLSRSRSLVRIGGISLNIAYGRESVAENCQK